MSTDSVSKVYLVSFGSEVPEQFLSDWRNKVMGVVSNSDFLVGDSTIEEFLMAGVRNFGDYKVKCVDKPQRFIVKLSDQYVDLWDVCEGPEGWFVLYSGPRLVRATKP